MIDTPTGWRRELRESGLVLLPPGGWELGGLRYQERVRPVRRFSEIVRELPAPTGWVTLDAGPIERLITGEGEHAALQRIDGTLHGRPVRRLVGMVLADDWYALLVGQSRDPAWHDELEAIFRRTLFADRLALGPRRRRFDHAAPAGWQGLAADHLHAHYLLPGAPRDPSRLVVYPAFPQATGLAADIVHAHFGAAPVARSRPFLVAGLAGQRLAAPCDADLVEELVVVEDASHVYAVGVRGRAEHLAVLDDLLATLRPLPGRHAAPARAGFDHWI